MVASAQLRGQPETPSLTLCGRPASPHQLFQPHAEPGGILHAEPAPFAAHAGLHRAQRLAIGVAGHQSGLVQVGPDGGKLVLGHAEQVDALAARHLHRGDREFLGYVGDGAQLGGRGHSAPHARHDGIGAVLLDVGVDPLIDEAGRGVVGIFARPGAEQIIVQRRTASGAAVGRLPAEGAAHGVGRLEAPRDDGGARLVMAGGRASADRLAAAIGRTSAVAARMA